MLICSRGKCGERGEKGKDYSLSTIESHARDIVIGRVNHPEKVMKKRDEIPVDLLIV